MTRPKAPVQLVGLMLVSVLVLALTGLFGIWYSHAEAGKALQNLSDTSRLIDGARQAQVEFKIQVQDWKNLLLRGQNARDFATYTERFARQSEKVKAELTEIASSPELPPALKSEIESIISSHDELLLRYREAMQQYFTNDQNSIFAVDRSVRGVDQKLNSRIDAIATQLVDLENRRHEELRASNEQLYIGLRWTSLIVGVIALACAGALAWRSLRNS